MPELTKKRLAAPDLSLSERARRLASSLIVSSDLGSYEPDCAEALQAARRDALEQAARRLEREMSGQAETNYQTDTLAWAVAMIRKMKGEPGP